MKSGKFRSSKLLHLTLQHRVIQETLLLHVGYVTPIVVPHAPLGNTLVCILSHWNDILYTFRHGLSHRIISRYTPPNLSSPSLIPTPKISKF